MKSIREYFKFHSSFKGRFSRKAYISITLKETLLLVLYLSNIKCVAAVSSTLENLVIGRFIVVLITIIFFSICISIYVSQSACIVKRLHDLNLSGYWFLLASFLTGVFVLVFGWSGGLTTTQSPSVMAMVISLVWPIIFLYWYLLIFLLTGVFDLIFQWNNMTAIQLPLVIEIIISLVQLFIIFGSVICLFFLKGTERDNKYGPDPLQEENLNIPKLSKKVLLLIIGLPVICLITLSSIIVVKKDFKGDLEEVQKVVEEAHVEMEEKEVRK